MIFIESGALRLRSPRPRAGGEGSWGGRHVPLPAFASTDAMSVGGQRSISLGCDLVTSLLSVHCHNRLLEILLFKGIALADGQ